MITKDEIVPSFLQACPSLRPAWEAHLREWEPETAGRYIDAAAVARFLADAHARGDVEVVTSAFGVLERILREGDDEARNVGVVGIIETLQNVAGSRVNADAFLAYLGPRTADAWDEVNRIWDGMEYRSSATNSK